MARGSWCLCRTSSHGGWSEGSKLLPRGFVGAMLLQLDGTHLEPGGPFKSADLGEQPTAGQARAGDAGWPMGVSGTPLWSLFDFSGQRHAEPRVLHSVWASPSGTPRDAEVSGSGAEGQQHRTSPGHTVSPAGSHGSRRRSPVKLPTSRWCPLLPRGKHPNKQHANKQTPTLGTERN